MEYDFFKALCLEMAEKIKTNFNPDEIVAVTRGGASAAHIIAKRLELPMGYFFPGSQTLVLSKKFSKRIIFVEDLVAQGRTHRIIKSYMSGTHGKDFVWRFAPVLVDGSYKEEFQFYGMKTDHWITFPYEEEHRMTTGDRSLFRDE